VPVNVVDVEVVVEGVVVGVVVVVVVVVVPTVEVAVTVDDALGSTTVMTPLINVFMLSKYAKVPTVLKTCSYEPP